MGMYGDKDIVVDPKQWKPLQAGIPHAHIERFQAAGHFIMLDEPQQFAEKLKFFLDQDDRSQAVQQPVSSPNPVPSVTL
jgi:pimeloyl-ACP methyl ester carboxylesterase